MANACVEGHLPVEVLFDETCTLQRLRSFPVVVLASAAAMEEREIEMFRRYVADGGVLVSTGDTSLYDGRGRPRRLPARMATFARSPEATVEAALTVESVVTCKPGIAGARTLVIHLIGFHARKEIVTRRSNMDDPPIRPGVAMEEPLMYRAVVRLPAALRSVRAWSPRTQLRQQGPEIQLLVRRSTKP